MYAGILIEMSVYSEYLNEIYFINENVELVSQKFVYDWKPILCGKCKGFGHLEGKCSKLEQRKRTCKPTPKPSMDEADASVGVGATRSLVAIEAKDANKAKEVIPHTLNNHGQIRVQQPHARTQSSTLLPTTPGTTTEIFLTNAVGEIVVTTIEVNNPKMRGKPSTSKG